MFHFENLFQSEKNLQKRLNFEITRTEVDVMKNIILAIMFVCSVVWSPEASAKAHKSKKKASISQKKHASKKKQHTAQNKKVKKGNRSVASDDSGSYRSSYLRKKRAKKDRSVASVSSKKAKKSKKKRKH